MPLPRYFELKFIMYAASVALIGPDLLPVSFFDVSLA